MVADKIADGEIGVKIEVDDVNRGYASELHMLLDTEKIEGLGWKAHKGLAEMYKNMIEGLRR